MAMEDKIGLRQVIHTEPGKSRGQSSLLNPDAFNLVPVGEFSITQIFPKLLREAQSNRIIGYTILGAEGLHGGKEARLDIVFHFDRGTQAGFLGRIPGPFGKSKLFRELGEMQEQISKQIGMSIRPAGSYRPAGVIPDPGLRPAYEFVREELKNHALFPYYMGRGHERISVEPVSSPTFEKIQSSGVLSAEALDYLAKDIEGALAVLTADRKQNQSQSDASATKQWTASLQDSPRSTSHQR